MKNLLTQAYIKNNGGEASFSELYRYTIIEIKTGRCKFTDRKPSLSYYSDFIAWDNRENCRVPNRKK